MILAKLSFDYKEDQVLACTENQTCWHSFYTKYFPCYLRLSVISRFSTNHLYLADPEMVLKTMRPNMARSLSLIKSLYVFNVLSRLCMLKIGTNAVEPNCKHLRFGLPKSPEREKVIRIMKWKTFDACICLD